jgi:hypothetical protein
MSNAALGRIFSKEIGEGFRPFQHNLSRNMRDGRKLFKFEVLKLRVVYVNSMFLCVENDVSFNEVRPANILLGAMSNY